MVVYGLAGFGAMAVVAVTVKPWFSEMQGAPGDIAGHGGATTLLNRNTVLLTAMSVIAGLVIYGYLGMYPTFLREGLSFTPATAGSVMSIYGLCDKPVRVGRHGGLRHGVAGRSQWMGRRGRDADFTAVAERRGPRAGAATRSDVAIRGNYFCWSLSRARRRRCSSIASRR